MEKQTGKQAKVIVEVPAISNGMDLGDRRREVAAAPGVEPLARRRHSPPEGCAAKALFRLAPRFPRGV